MKIESANTTLNRLHNDEHLVAAKAVKEAAESKVPATNDVILTAYQQKLSAQALTEEEKYKSIMASERTPLMEYINHERSFAIGIITRVVDNAADALFDADRKAAGQKLLPFVRAYRGMTNQTRAGETGDIFNFMDDFDTPANAPAITLLALPLFVERAKNLNQQYYDLLSEREREWLSTHHGSLAPVRRTTDIIIQDFVDGVNLHYKVAPSPALEELIDAINAALQPFRRIAARRIKHSSSGSSSGKEDEGTQTPPEGNSPDSPSNPSTPDSPSNPSTPTDPQNPNTTLPNAPDLPNQNPAANPPQINPDDLNPPAAGE